jgi:hypothetical protein
MALLSMQTGVISRASVCVLVVYDALYKELASVSIPSIRRLADAHGYTLRMIERNDCARPGGWIKIEPIIATLAEAFDFVLWIDADTFVARLDLDIRNVIQPNTQLHIAWHRTREPNVDPPHFNTGVMLIRSSDWSRAFFARVWEHGPLRHRWRDQATIHHVLGYDWIAGIGDDRIGDIDGNPLSSLNTTWNSIPDICALVEPVIWHFAGTPIERRLSLMKEMSK